MRADRASLIWIAACACTGGAQDVELPVLDDAVHAILVVSEGDGFSLRAYDATLAPSRISLDEGVRIVTVLHHRESLEELGLTAGDLAIATDRDCASVPIPPWSALFAGPAGGPMEPISALTEAIAELRIAVPCPCVELEVTTFPLPDTVVRTARPYDEERVLLVSNAGFVLVDRDADFERVPAPAAYWGSFEDQQGTFWFGDDQGQLWLGDPLGRLRRTFTSTATRDLVRAGGYVLPDRFELLTVTKDGLLMRFDGSSWTLLFQQGHLSDDQDGNLVFLRPGRAVATLPDGNGILQYDASSAVPVELEEWNPAERGHLTVLELIEPFGMFIATRLGRTFLRAPDGGPLLDLEDPIPIGERLAFFDIHPFRGGFIGVGRRGVIRQWHPASGFCEPINVDFQIDLHAVTTLGDTVFAAGESRSPSANTGFVIRPIAPAQP